MSMQSALQCDDLILLPGRLAGSTLFIATLCSILLCQDRSFFVFDLLVYLGAPRGFIAVHPGW